MAGLAWNALAQDADRIEGSVCQALSADARTIAATNLAIAEECRQLRDEFAAARLPLLFVKGLTVGALAYRAPLLKMGWDIDLLIDPGDLAAARELLLRRNYRLQLPRELPDLQRWHERSKESVWSREGRFYVELHTRLADNPRLVPAIDVHSGMQTVQVGPGIELPTLAPDELFAFLCVHGASSAWFRLKWISDLAGLLSRHDPGEIERLYRRSLELGARQAPAQALLLADWLFGSLEGTGLRRELQASRFNRWLCRLALAQLAADRQEPTATPLGTWRIHLNQTAIGGGMGFAASDLSRQLGDALFLRRFR